MGSHQVLVLVDEDAPSSRRRSPRRRVLLNCMLLTTTDEFPVKLRNLSASGAMMEGVRLPGAGTDVILRRGDSEVFASVAWADPQRGGLHFDEPIEDWESWLRPVPHIAEPVGASRARPRLGAVALTPDQESLARTWANPAGRPGFGD